MDLKEDVIWHEYGHIFSYKLIEKISGKNIRVIELMLDKEEEKNPFVKTDCMDFVRFKDEKWKLFQERLKENFKSNGFYYQCIINLMGAIFQIECRIPKPTIGHFEEIFTNNGEQVSDDNLIGHAGADFENIKSYVLDYEEEKFMCIDMKCFALTLHTLLKKQKTFELLEDSISGFNKKYNGKHLKGTNLLIDEFKALGVIIDDCNLVQLVNSAIQELKSKAIADNA